MTEPISKDELLVVMTAGARLAPEPSHALPAAAYRDPAESVLLDREKPKPKTVRRKLPKINKKWR